MAYKTREAIVADLVSQVSTMSSDQWRKMWLTLGRTVPVSAVTGKAYRGGNRWILTLRQVRRGFASARWLTLKQVRQLGGRVKDEEFRNDVTCEYWQRIEKKGKGKAKEKTEGEQPEVMTEDGKRMYLMCRPFWLYNVEQCEGLPEHIVAPAAELPPLSLRFENVDRFVQATGAHIVHGDDRAFFSPGDDRIGMPDPVQFVGDDETARVSRYYSTLLHELVHWTGHKSRLDRLTLTFFGSPEYAQEELVAEFGSAILCSELGIPMDDLQHPEYLAHWLEAVRAKPDVLLTSANTAEKAVSFLYQLTGMAPEMPKVEAPVEAMASSEAPAETTDVELREAA